MEWKLSRKTQQRFRHFRVWKELEQAAKSHENHMHLASKKAPPAVGFLKPSFSVY
jgi:hypothetical protein